MRRRVCPEASQSRRYIDYYGSVRFRSAHRCFHQQPRRGDRLALMKSGAGETPLPTGRYAVADLRFAEMLTALSQVTELGIGELPEPVIRRLPTCFAVSPSAKPLTSSTMRSGSGERVHERVPQPRSLPPLQSG